MPGLPAILSPLAGNFVSTRGNSVDAVLTNMFQHGRCSNAERSGINMDCPEVKDPNWIFDNFGRQVILEKT